MSELTTEAGTRLADDGMYHAVECWMSGATDPCDCGLVDRILAIEEQAYVMGHAEAQTEAAAEIARLRRIEEAAREADLRWWDPDGGSGAVSDAMQALRAALEDR